MNVSTDKKTLNSQNLEGRIISLERDYAHIDRRLNKIDDAIDDISKDVKSISGKISQYVGATNAKRTGWKVLSYVVTALIALGIHHIILKYWHLHL